MIIPRRVTRIAFIALTFSLLLALPVSAETIRGPLVGVIELQESGAGGADADAREQDFRPEDVVGLDLTDSLRFLEGIQVELSIPRAVREVPGGLGLYIYAAPTASLEAGGMSREGRQLFFLPLPARSRVLVQVPFAEDHDFRRTADVYVAAAAGESALPLVLQVVPVMKGIPGRAATSQFSVTAQPLIRNIGAVRPFLIHPDGQIITDLDEYDLTLTLDGEPVESLDEEITVLPGLHRISLEAAEFENETLTFGVERGRVRELRLELQRPRSSIQVDAPETAELFVNGERIGEGAGNLTLPPGEHTVLFRIGDYTVSRKLTIEPKQDYEISLSLDILIDED